MAEFWETAFAEKQLMWGGRADRLCHLRERLLRSNGRQGCPDTRPWVRQERDGVPRSQHVSHWNRDL